MIRKRLDNLALAILIGVASLLIAQPALACSVCFGGDPNSSMNQGVQAGMLVLLGVAGVVLTGLASLFLFWMRRAANLENRGEAVEEPRGVYATAAHHNRSGA
ncbi:MAG: hypothetical protein V3T08_00875 [Gemmatimonadota bacterium]